MRPEDIEASVCGLGETQVDGGVGTIADEGDCWKGN